MKKGKIAANATLGFFAIGVLSAIAYSQPSQSTQKESLIRTTYAKLTLYNAAANSQAAAESNTPYKSNDDLRFEIRNIHTGPIQEISEKAIGEVVTKPTGEVVSIVHTVRTLDGGPEHVAYRAKWVVSGYQGSLLEDWEHTSMARMLQLTGGTDVTEYTSYEVTVHLADRERTYNAMILYHDSFQSTVEPRVDFLDNIVGQSALNNALTEKRPPVKAPWFEYVKSDEYRTYVESQKKGAVKLEKKNEEDQQDQEPFARQPPLPDLPESCDWAVTIGPEVGKYRADYTYHTGPLSYGQHEVQTAAQGICIYDQNCYVRCSVNDTHLEANEFGFPSSSCHVSGSNVLYENSTAPAMSGASCATTQGVAFKACLFCQCSVSVTITPISVSSDGFWTYQHKLSHSCPCLH